MIKWAKVVNEETKACEVGLGDNGAYYAALGYTQQDVEQDYKGGWYLKGYAPAKPEPTIQQQIESLEAQITERNLRSAILGDSWAINKITQIEEQIAELRRLLDEQ